jgi:hypothetical protein
MMSAWANLSAWHVREAVMEWADALDAAAGYIVVQKAEAIAELEGMVAAFFADQAAVAATVGLAWPESSSQIIPRGGGGSATRRPPPRRPDAADYRHRLGEAIEDHADR